MKSSTRVDGYDSSPKNINPRRKVSSDSSSVLGRASDRGLGRSQPLVGRVVAGTL
jgi:hypothetical protein